MLFWKESMLKFFYILLVLTTFFTGFSKAQELNCNVNIDGTNAQLTAADKTLLENLKPAMMNFMNNRKWTSDVFSPEERIKCNIYITIKTIPAFGSFEATASIQASRPVYESTYETTILNFFDKSFNFDYNPSQPLDFNENSFFSNLTSMLGFYAYIIIGTDYDSFSKYGGTPYFEKARNIANSASAADGGWTQGESTNNRYWLIENYNNQQMMPFREGLYIYHRLGMDKFIANPAQSRKDIYDVLKKIKQAKQYNPFAILIKSFFLAKTGELVKVFSEAPSGMKTEVTDLLKELDPPNSAKYDQILK
jgi:hypothetical protein